MLRNTIRGRYVAGKTHSAHHDHGQAHRRAVQQELPGREPAKAVQDHRQLEPDQDKRQPGEQKDDHVPHGPALQPRGGGHDRGAEPADVDPGGHRRQHPGEERLAPEPEQLVPDEVGHLLRRQVRRERREQGDDDLDRRVVERREGLDDDPPHRQADGDAPDGHHHELQARPPDGKGGPGRHAGRDPVSHDARRVVDEALALEQRDDPARHPEPLRDGGRGYGVGGGDDSPEHEGAHPA
jgi:hypothetical protein